MTSSPPSSRLAAAVSTECPASPDGNRGKGLRSLWHLSRHLTARADDNHAAPPRRSEEMTISCHSLRSSSPGKVPRVSSHVPPLVRAPVNSFEFHRCRRTPQVGYLTLSLGDRKLTLPTASIHRLLCGLPGYLILFDTHTFEPQRQSHSRQLPTRSEFFVISKHFTATPRIPLPLRELKASSINGTAWLSHTISPLT